jgi:hypothetical protein
MSFGPLRLLLLGALGVSSCGDGAPAAIISQVSPYRAYSDRPQRLTISGQGFLPAFEIDPAGGRRRGEVAAYRGWVGTDTQLRALRDFDWIDKNVLTATLEAGLPAGQHMVEVVDPRGQAASKMAAFWSLGNDHDRPVVTFEKPGPLTAVVGGTTLDVAIRAFDPEPGSLDSLHWDSSAGGNVIDNDLCRFEETHASARCDFQVMVPLSLVPGDEFVLEGIATDTAVPPNRTVEKMVFIVQRPPTVIGISPTLGGIAGGTDLVLRGSGFAPGTKVYVGGLLLLPDGGTVMDEQTIFGRTPAHAEGSATVLVRTPIGDVSLTDTFLYAQPPQITSIIPELGDPDGATIVRVRGTRFTKNTRIFFGDTLAGAEPCEIQSWDSDTQISGAAPAGRGRTSVWAFDPDLGFSRLPDGFGWSAP